MKKLSVLLAAFVLLLLVASCVNIYPSSPPAKESPQTTQTSQAAQSAQASESIPETSAQPYDGPVIISAYGDVIGGWADGKWQTHSEAAAYCEGATTFYQYGIAGLAGEVKSSGLTSEPSGGFCFSQTTDMGGEGYDESDAYTLTTEPTPDYGDYSNDPFSAAYLYTLPPECLPQMDVLDNTAELEPVIQKMIDDNLGAGSAEANIRSAIVGDIDGDGGYENIVNADNCAGLIYEEKANMYSISIIIESDGSVVSVNESYVSDNNTDFSETELVYVQNVLDIDGDGMCELVLDGEAWESSWTEVYKYDGKLSQVLIYGTGA